MTRTALRRLLSVLPCALLGVLLMGVLQGCDGEPVAVNLKDPKGWWATRNATPVTPASGPGATINNCSVGLQNPVTPGDVAPAESGSATAATLIDWDGDGPGGAVPATLTGGWTQTQTQVSVNLREADPQGTRLDMSLHMIDDKRLAGSVEVVHEGVTYTGPVLLEFENEL